MSNQESGPAPAEVIGHRDTSSLSRDESLLAGVQERTGGKGVEWTSAVTSS